MTYNIIHQKLWLHYRKVRLAVEVFAALGTAALFSYLILHSQR